MTPSNNTKTNILSAAKLLFAQNGYSGTSIREIASTANANVAAISYHFSNKQNLFWQVFKEGFLEMESILSEVAEKSDGSLENLVVNMFSALCDNWAQMSTMFRMILSTNLPVADQEYRAFCEGRLGPPGSEIISNAIARELEGVDLSEESLRWSVECIWTYICHWGLIINTEYVKEFCTNKPDLLDRDRLETAIRHHTRAICAYVKQQAIEMN